MAGRNVLLAAMREGRLARGVFLSFPSPGCVEILGRLGLDFVYFDGEHGPFDIADIADGCRAAEAAALTPIARVPDHGAVTLARFLDMGVMGLLVPHVDTAEQAAAVVRACRFAPEGERSWGSGRPRHGFLDGTVAEEMTRLNRETAVSVMIESGEGARNARAIAEVPGIDFVSIGIFDLALSLGHPGDPKHPEVRTVIEGIGRDVRAAGGRMRADVLRYAWLRELLVAGVADRLAPDAPARD